MKSLYSLGFWEPSSTGGAKRSIMKGKSRQGAQSFVAKGYKTAYLC